MYRPPPLYCNVYFLLYRRLLPHLLELVIFLLHIVKLFAEIISLYLIARVFIGSVSIMIPRRYLFDLWASDRLHKYVRSRVWEKLAFVTITMWSRRKIYRSDFHPLCVYVLSVAPVSCFHIWISTLGFYCNVTVTLCYVWINPSLSFSLHIMSWPHSLGF